MRALLYPASKFPVLTDLALLASRVALGVILLAHGWQKFSEYTVAGTAASFNDMGVPAPTVAAIFATVVEIFGGAALILGLLAPVAAALNIVNLLGALVLVHASNGLFVDNGGYELVLGLAAGLLIIALLGAGKFSADSLLGRRTTSAAAAVPA
jgi:putative oxidoreductase